MFQLRGGLTPLIATSMREASNIDKRGFKDSTAKGRGVATGKKLVPRSVLTERSKKDHWERNPCVKGKLGRSILAYERKGTRLGSRKTVHA